jgi:hypothetical protein
MKSSCAAALNDSTVKLARDRVKVTVGRTMVTLTGSSRLLSGGEGGGFHPLIAPFRVALETMVPFICRARL